MTSKTSNRLNMQTKVLHNFFNWQVVQHKLQYAIILAVAFSMFCLKYLCSSLFTRMGKCTFICGFCLQITKKLCYLIFVYPTSDLCYEAHVF